MCYVWLEWGAIHCIGIHRSLRLARVVCGVVAVFVAHARLFPLHLLLYLLDSLRIALSCPERARPASHAQAHTPRSPLSLSAPHASVLHMARSSKAASACHASTRRGNGTAHQCRRGDAQLLFLWLVSRLIRHVVPLGTVAFLHTHQLVVVAAFAPQVPRRRRASEAQERAGVHRAGRETHMMNSIAWSLLCGAKCSSICSPSATNCRTSASTLSRSTSSCSLLDAPAGAPPPDGTTGGRDGATAAEAGGAGGHKISHCGRGAVVGAEGKEELGAPTPQDGVLPALAQIREEGREVPCVANTLQRYLCEPRCLRRIARVLPHHELVSAAPRTLVSTWRLPRATRPDALPLLLGAARTWQGRPLKTARMGRLS